MIDLKVQTSGIYPVQTKLYPVGVPKQCVSFNGHVYMMKLPGQVGALDTRLIIEYLASQIYGIASVAVPKTKLVNVDKIGITLMSSDFTDGYPLYSLSQFFNSVMKDTVKFETVTEFFDAIRTLTKTYNKLNFNVIDNRFWTMFVFDAFVNNIYRSLDDWGFVITEDDYALAPVYGLSKSFVAVDAPVDEWNNHVYNQCHPTKMMNPFDYIHNNIATNHAILHAVYMIVEHSLDDFLNPVHELRDAFPELDEKLERIEHLLIVNYNKLLSILNNDEQANIHQLRKSKVHQYYENHKMDYSQNEDGFVRICGATPPLLLCKQIGINLSDNYERAYVTLCLSDKITPCSADSAKFKVYT